MHTSFIPDTAPSLHKARRRGLNRLSWLRSLLVTARLAYLRVIYGMDIHPTAQLSLRAGLDRTFPKGVHVGAHTYLAFDSVVLAHDRTRGLYAHTRIGRNCFIGARAMILPGLSIGDGSVIGAGAVVTRDVPAGCIVAGNPAQILRSDVNAGPYGRLPEADATEHRLALTGQT